MDMAADVLIPCHRVYHLVTDILRMRCGEPHAQNRAYFRHHRKQVREIHLLFWCVRIFPQIGIHILAEKSNLLVSLGEHIAGLPHDSMRVTAALGSTGIGHHAI